MTKLKYWCMCPNMLFAFATIMVAGLFLLLISPALASDNIRYVTFVAVTKADTDDGKDHRFIGGGDAVFDPDTGWVNGGGTFEHVDFAPEGKPKPALGTGKWVAKKVLSHTPCNPPDTCTSPGGNTYGQVRPGVVELDVDLYFDGGKKIEGAVLKVVCNVGFGGIVNKDPTTGASLPEGYFITFTDPQYGRLEFKPLDPIIGVTLIAVVPPHALK